MKTHLCWPSVPDTIGPFSALRDLSRAALLAACGAVACASHAAIISVESKWVGGLFAEGAKMNDFAHQNYFVGYGTTPGFGRTAERRSFFWYDIPEFDGDVLSVTLELKLMFSTSLIFGLDPVDPSVKDPKESFALGFSPLGPGMFIDPGLTAPEVIGLFGTMDDMKVAPDTDFLSSVPIGLPATVVIPFDDFGKGVVDGATGGPLVLTGWMPTWSHDSRLDGSGGFLEGSELIFGFSDVTGPSGGLVPKPVLTIEYAPVPEPASILALGAGVAALVKRRRKK